MPDARAELLPLPTTAGSSTAPKPRPRPQHVQYHGANANLNSASAGGNVLPPASANANGGASASASYAPPPPVPPELPFTFENVRAFPTRFLNPPDVSHVPRIRSYRVKPHFQVTLDDILSNKHLPPLSSTDFENFLTYVECDRGSVQNLYFILWLKEYTAQYNDWKKSTLALQAQQQSNPNAPPSAAPTRSTASGTNTTSSSHPTSSSQPSSSHHPQPNLNPRKKVRAPPSKSLAYSWYRARRTFFLPHITDGGPLSPATNPVYASHLRLRVHAELLHPFVEDKGFDPAFSYGGGGEKGEGDGGEGVWDGFPKALLENREDERVFGRTRRGLVDPSSLPGLHSEPGSGSAGAGEGKTRAKGKRSAGGGGGLVHPAPERFELIRQECEKALDESLKRFIDVSFSNTGNHRGLFGTSLSILNFVAAGVVLTCIAAWGKSYALFLASYFFLWNGSWGVIVTLNGICCCVFLFGSRQWFPYEVDDCDIDGSHHHSHSHPPHSHLHPNPRSSHSHKLTDDKKPSTNPKSQIESDVHPSPRTVVERSHPSESSNVRTLAMSVSADLALDGETQEQDIIELQPLPSHSPSALDGTSTAPAVADPSRQQPRTAKSKSKSRADESDLDEEARRLAALEAKQAALLERENAERRAGLEEAERRVIASGGVSRSQRAAAEAAATQRETELEVEMRGRLEVQRTPGPATARTDTTGSYAGLSATGVTTGNNGSGSSGGRGLVSRTKRAPGSRAGTGTTGSGSGNGAGAEIFISEAYSEGFSPSSSLIQISLSGGSDGSVGDPNDIDFELEADDDGGTNAISISVSVSEALSQVPPSQTYMPSPGPPELLPPLPIPIGPQSATSASSDIGEVSLSALGMLESYSVRADGPPILYPPPPAPTCPPGYPASASSPAGARPLAVPVQPQLIPHDHEQLKMSRPSHIRPLVTTSSGSRGTGSGSGSGTGSGKGSGLGLTTSPLGPLLSSIPLISGAGGSTSAGRGRRHRDRRQIHHQSSSTHLNTKSSADDAPSPTTTAYDAHPHRTPRSANKNEGRADADIEKTADNANGGSWPRFDFDRLPTAPPPPELTGPRRDIAFLAPMTSIQDCPLVVRMQWDLVIRSMIWGLVISTVLEVVCVAVIVPLRMKRG